MNDPRLAGFLLISAVALASACGSGKPGTGGSTSAGSGGGSSSGSESGPSGTSSAGSTTATSSSGGAGGATSSSTTGSGGAPGTGGSVGSVACPPSGSLAVQGMLSGAPFQLPGVPVSPVSVGTASSTLLIEPDGLLVWVGTPSPTMGQPSPITGFFLLPTGSPDPQTWFALGAGSAVTTNADGTFSLSLAGIRRLGTCPGAPSSGTLSYCVDIPNHSCGGKVSSSLGSVGGSPFDWSASGAFTVLGGGTGLIQWFNGAFVVVLLTPQNAVTNGLLLMPPSGPDPGAYYCVDSFDVTDVATTVGGFTRLGTAAQGTAAGSLAACYAP